ncbi:MAG: Type 1 glutamine amidotransferase-like domain-containing protein [Chloroflexi bacterium]|nr:Type 1 glutamine amidotransferase-like domain-containing protein [Chloroflexota bacterium]
MSGLIALLGSGEYLPVMNTTDSFLLKQAVPDGRTPRVVCFPTAAGTEGDASINRWMQMGQEHFQALGADVQPLHITNRAEADDPQYLALIEQADLIYFSGGNPSYLFESLHGSLAWDAVLAANQRGAVFAGCSAGAMFIGEFLPDLRGFKLRQKKAFGLLTNSHIFPHFDRMVAWRGITLPILQGLIPEGEYALGLDEDTALVGRPGSEWNVMGRQKVYVITKTEIKTYAVGEQVTLPA